MAYSQLEILEKFNQLLEQCYKGKLIAFCSNFDIRNREGFYKKVQRSRNRMIKQKVSEETLDEFKKYILFLEARLIEKKCTWDEKKAVQEFKRLIQPD